MIWPSIKKIIKLFLKIQSYLFGLSFIHKSRHAEETKNLPYCYTQPLL